MGSEAVKLISNNTSIAKIRGVDKQQLRIKQVSNLEKMQEINNVLQAQMKVLQKKEEEELRSFNQSLEVLNLNYKNAVAKFHIEHEMEIISLIGAVSQDLELGGNYV